MDLKRTPLTDWHESAGAKMANFAGTLMPMEYVGMRQENLSVRKKVGIFDVSHMGVLQVQGEKVGQKLEALTANLVSRLEAGQAQYNLIMNSAGGVVDDVLIYCLIPQDAYFLVVNAGNIQSVKQALTVSMSVEHLNMMLMAVQGPKSFELLKKLGFAQPLNRLKSFEFVKIGSFWLAQTGYTGEQGVEIFTSDIEAGIYFWEKMVEEGQPYGVQPAGLAARDSLRLEMGYPLYGQDLDAQTNPLECGLSWVVKDREKDFLGCEVIRQQRQKGLVQVRRGLLGLERRMPRNGYLLYNQEDQCIGKITSGGFSPTLEKPIALARIDRHAAQLEQTVWMKIADKTYPMVITQLPFLPKST